MLTTLLSYIPRAFLIIVIQASLLSNGPFRKSKTLTAEVLLEGFKSPSRFSMLTMNNALSQIMLTSQISSEAEVLNLQLYQAFETASHWKALLLLNEADVFL